MSKRARKVTVIDGNTPDWRQGIRDSAMFVCLVSANWLDDPHCQAQAAYAWTLGKPFRVLVLGNVHLPEDAFMGVADLQIIRMRTPAEAAEMLVQWAQERERAEEGGEDDASDRALLRLLRHA